MGAYERRQLRAAMSLLFYPLLLALVLTLFAKTLFTSRPRVLKPLPDSPRGNAAQRHPQSQTHPSQPQSAATADQVISKALVIASTTKDDTAWLSQISPSQNWTIHHYRVDAPLSPELSVPSTNGNEAVVYLTYIIDNYDTLPDITLFHHAHLTAWHQKLTSLDEVRRLRPEYVLKAGYASTRCLSGCENIVPLEGGRPGDWSNFARLDRKTHLVTLLDAFLDPKKGEGEGEGRMAAAAVKPMPTKLAAPCCAQFAVSADRIRGRSRDWWIDLRGWVVNTPLESINSGRLMEHLWHVWFGMPAEL